MSTQKKIIAGAILLFVIFNYFFSSQKITNYPSSGKDVIAFGDSLIQGVGTENGGFVTLLSKETGIPIINLGKSGDTTVDGVSRLSEVFIYKPKVVLVLFGGNDALRRIPQEETFKNLGEIISQIQSKGAVVVLLGVRGGILSDKYSSGFKALSKKYGTVYVSDVLSGIFGHSDLMSDEIHPNEKGYAKIAERIASVLEGVLK